MNFYVGTSGFAYKEWKGSFYPADLPASKMLSFYGGHFPSVEVNNTFYSTPQPSVMAAWAGEVPRPFKFAIKAPQRITHRRDLSGAGRIMSDLQQAMQKLGVKLGPLLFQLPPWMKKDAGRLQQLLDLVPSRQRAAFEFRHPSWFDDEIFDLLRKNRSALCGAEAEKDLEVPFVATANWGYLRLRRVDYNEKALRAWATRVRAQKWKDVFVYFKHEDTGAGPDFARRFLGYCDKSKIKQAKRVGQ